MHTLFTATSTTADGSMYNPLDQSDPSVTSHREAWLKKNGFTLADTTRLYITYDGTDFCRYKEVGAQEKGIGLQKAIPSPADALITTTPGQVLFLPVADCVATIFFDPAKGVLMLSHLGRHSLEQDGAVRSVAHLTEHYGSKPEDIQVWLSPTPSKAAYAIYTLNNRGMKEVAFEQLERAGIRAENITDNPADTATDPRYFSHSAFLKGEKSEDGRFAVVAVMKEAQL